jgi:hypothetical protein
MAYDTVRSGQRVTEYISQTGRAESDIVGSRNALTNV